MVKFFDFSKINRQLNYIDKTRRYLRTETLDEDRVVNRCLYGCDYEPRDVRLLYRSYLIGSRDND